MKEVYAKEAGKYKRLNEIERGKIEAYYNEGKSISYIAKRLERLKSTISEEIKKSKYNGRYVAHIAQNRANKRRKESHKHTNMSSNIRRSRSARGNKRHRHHRI